MNAVFRYDTSTVNQWRDDDRGGLISPAHATRIGVFEYSEYDPETGETRTWGELRDPEHVFDRKSLDTLKAVPVTDLHPSEGMVTAENWQKLARGHVGDDVHVNGDRVAITLHIQDAGLAQLARDGERQDISLGYKTDLVHKPGVWRGAKYDYIQTNIRYNHAAVGPKDWGRAGPRVGLRTDSKNPQKPAGLAPNRQRQPSMSITTITTKNDGRTLQLGSQTFDTRNGGSNVLDNARAALAVVQSARKDQANLVKEDSPEALKAWTDQLMGVVASLEGTILEMTDYAMQAEEMAMDPESIPVEAMDAAVKVRTEVLAQAKAIRPDGKYDGKTNHEVRIEALAGRFDSAELQKSSTEYVMGLFAGASPAADSRTDSRNRSNGNRPNVREGFIPAQNNDGGNDVVTPHNYKADARKAAGNQWRNQ